MTIAGTKALAVAGMLVLLGCGTRAPPTDIEAAADSLLEALHERGWFNGAVVMGVRGVEIYARGFGPANAGAGVAFTPDTAVDGGSIAKTLTAAAVFLLQEQGRLHLDDRVQRHLPEFPHAETRVRHLISHSAGLPEADYDFFDSLIAPDAVRTTSLFLDVLREGGVAPAFVPGTRFRYSSLGFDVAALLVERISGQTWEAFLREHVMDPLGMDATFVRPARLAEWRGVRTLSYRRVGGDLEVADIFDNEGFYGGSNLYFSARDLYRWVHSFHHQPVLGADALAAGAEAARLVDPQSLRGGRSMINLLSWYYPEHGRRFHYPGSLEGFWSSAYRDDERGYSIVYVSNNSMPQWLRPLLMRALVDILDGRRPAPLEAPALEALGASDLPAIRGAYRIDGVGALSIEGEGDQTLVRIDDGIDYPAYLVGDGQLYVPGLDVWLGFPAGADERFRHASWLSIFVVASGERVADIGERH